MIEHRPFHDWQSEANSAGFGRAKRGKDFVLYFRCDAGAVVPDRDDYGRLSATLHDRFRRKYNARFAPIRAGFRRIGDEVGERFCQRRFIAQDARQITRQRRFQFHFAVDPVLGPGNLHAFLERRTDINWFQHKLRWMGEVIDLGNNLIQPINFADHDLIEFLAKIRVVEALWKQLSEGLDRDERVALLASK